MSYVVQAALVKAVLEKWRAFEWTKQGFGFLRTKIDNARIHVWDSRLAVPLVSTAHTHPWPLRSTIISGELINQRFERNPHGPLHYTESLIATGEGGGLLGDPIGVTLLAHMPLLYTAGMVYAQEPSDIHRTLAQDGTVTLMERPQDGRRWRKHRCFGPQGRSG